MKFKEDLNLWELANVRPDKTGLPMVIYISPKGKSKHSARIKIGKEYGNKFNPYNTIPVTIENIPKVIGKIGKLKEKDVNKAIKFVKINKDVLIKYWNDELDSVDALIKIKKV